MEEKKLNDTEIDVGMTNEEIVKSLEHCFHNRSCEYCYHNYENGSGEIVCRSRLMGKALDLIRRLQSGYSSASKASEEWKAKYEAERKENETIKAELKKELAEHEEFTKKAKEEIERLTSLYDSQSAFMTSSIGDLPLTVAGLRKAVDEIARLNIVQAELQELNAKYYNEAKDLRRENDELQKQVDELKAKQVIECHGMLKGCDMVKQAVKDTAKEIFKEIFESCVFSFKGNDDYKKGFCDALEQYDKQLRDLAKQKGVEVE